MKRLLRLLTLLTVLLSARATQAVTPAPTQVPPPVIISANQATGAVGIRFSYQIAATNSPTLFRSAFLPGGLSLDPDTGLISGIPLTAGTFTCTLVATNAGGGGALTFTITVKNLPPAILSDGMSRATLYQPYSFQLAASNQPISFGAANLPPGLQIDPTTGLISGTPIVAGVYNVTVSATNTVGPGTGTLVLSVVSTLSTVTVQATVPRVAVDGDGDGEIVVTRAGGDLSQKLVIEYVVQGTARSGLDYVTLSGQKKIKPGHPTTAIRIVPQGTLSGGQPRTVKVKLLPETTYQLGDTIKAKVKIVPAD